VAETLESVRALKKGTTLKVMVQNNMQARRNSFIHIFRTLLGATTNIGDRTKIAKYNYNRY
jgi:hypothetical protein